LSNEWIEKMKDAQQVRAGETVLPAFRKRVFHCQFCHAYLPQEWTQLYAGYQSEVETLVWACECTNCYLISYWLDSKSPSTEPKVIYPGAMTAPAPHPEMPEDVRADYQEAGRILAASPRGAGALLRLALQKLMPHLGEKGENLNDDIAALVRKGLDPQIQQALDGLRVIGAHAVHPLELDLRDDTETVGGLFALLNLIIEERIARPAKLQEMYDRLPEAAPGSYRQA
jgi:hypothetical protein